ncbi:MAG: ABC transporter permease [Oligoflexia bacterium]|nr:ABC transporter permease [Oligoflexia bacterium]
MSQLFRLSWRNLFRNPRRTAASLLTVALGAAGLLIYQGFNEGIMNQYRENTIRVRYGHGQVYPKGYREKVMEKPWTAWIEDPAAVEARILAVPGVKAVFPRVAFYSFVTKGELTLAGRGEGIMPERENRFFTAMNFEEGHDLQASDEIVLGKGLARSLDAKPGDRITLLAQTVRGQLNGADLRVAGIFHTGAKEFDDAYFRIDLKAAQALLDTQRVEHLALQTGGVEDWPHVSAALRSALPALEPIAFDELDKVYYKNSVDFLEAQFSFIRLVILFIVALGIFNTIAVGLLERAPEIGALRANGETRGRLLRILVCENALLGVLGGLLGIVVAVLLDRTVMASGIPMPPGPGITRQFRIFLEIQPQHFGQALALPVLTTIVASLHPVLKLLRRKIPDLLISH